MCINKIFAKKVQNNAPQEFFLIILFFCPKAAYPWRLYVKKNGKNRRDGKSHIYTPLSWSQYKILLIARYLFSR
jgi:hypothetical protein